MILPDYWLTRPDTKADDHIIEAFDRLLDDMLATGANHALAYDLPAPKWQFLCHAAETHGLALHGSGNPNIAIFEPRQPNDLTEFGNQKAVYAAADGIWPMYYAIVDRASYSMSLNNACIYIVDAQGNRSKPYYLFSISRQALVHQPWRTGYVYLLPRATFAQQPPMPLAKEWGEYEAQVPQLASPVAVTPLARLEIFPQDFPFLAQIRGHEDARLREYGEAMMSGSPWPDPY